MNILFVIILKDFVLILIASLRKKFHQSPTVIIIASVNSIIYFKVIIKICLPQQMGIFFLFYQNLCLLHYKQKNVNWVLDY